MGWRARGGKRAPPTKPLYGMPDGRKEAEKKSRCGYRCAAERKRHYQTPDDQAGWETLAAGGREERPCRGSPAAAAVPDGCLLFTARRKALFPPLPPEIRKKNKKNGNPYHANNTRPPHVPFDGDGGGGGAAVDAMATRRPRRRRRSAAGGPAARGGASQRRWQRPEAEAAADAATRSPRAAVAATKAVAVGVAIDGTAVGVARVPLPHEGDVGSVLPASRTPQNYRLMHVCSARRATGPCALGQISTASS